MLSKKERNKLIDIDVSFLVDATHSLGLPESHFDYGIKPVAPSKKLVGTALTIRLETIKDKKLANLDLYKDLLSARPNVSYPVVAIEIPKELHNSGIWGEGAATLAKSSGFVGAVIDGAVRDINILRSIEIPTFCRIIAPGFMVCKVSDVGNPIIVGGKNVCNGDIIVGDDDGVIVIKPENLSDVITKAKAIHEWEQIVHKEFSEGNDWKNAFKIAGPMP